MNMLNLSSVLLAAGFLMAAPAFAQTTPAQKQPTQEGGSSFAPLPCGLPFNANSSADPNCKQRTQNLTPTPGQAAVETTGKQK
jgi:hypothetical protein